jgi:transcription elongation factor GreB
MSKAFTKESDDDASDDETALPDPLPKGQKNYITPRGHAALQAEYAQLLHKERPKIVEIVSWAAGNGDRSENGDYIYGKKRLREIDRRIHYLSKSLERAVIVDPSAQQSLRQVFFGATVTYAREDGSEHTVTLVGVDEVDVERARISWLSPVATALMKSKVGDVVKLRIPSGSETLEVVAIAYPLN